MTLILTLLQLYYFPIMQVAGQELRATGCTRVYHHRPLRRRANLPSIPGMGRKSGPNFRVFRPQMGAKGTAHPKPPAASSPDSQPFRASVRVFDDKERTAGVDPEFEVVLQCGPLEFLPPEL